MKIETVEEFVKRGGVIKNVVVNKPCYQKRIEDWKGRDYTKEAYENKSASKILKKKIKNGEI